MGAAFTLSILAAIALLIVGGAFALYILCVLAKAAVQFFRHECLMRPQFRYYRM